MHWIIIVSACLCTAFLPASNGEAAQWNITDPMSQLVEVCQRKRGGGISLVCDPQNLLSPLERRVLQKSLDTGLKLTVCFCGPTCHSNTGSTEGRLALGAIILSELPPSYTSGHLLVRDLHAKLSMGTCPGNDLLMILVGAKIYATYGPLVARHFTPSCMSRLPRAFKSTTLPLTRLRFLGGLFKTMLLSSCPCGVCVTSTLTFNVTAMLVACVFLFSGVSVLTRRARARWVSPSSHVSTQRPQRPPSPSPVHGPMWTRFNDWTDARAPNTERRFPSLTERGCSPHNGRNCSSSESVEHTPEIPRKLHFQPPPSYSSLPGSNSTTPSILESASIRSNIDLPPTYDDVIQYREVPKTTFSPRDRGGDRSSDS